MPDTINVSRAKIVQEATYFNLLGAAQNAVWTFVRAACENSSQSRFKTINVFDRIPERLTQDVGFPFVVVPIPNTSNERLTYTMERTYLSFDLEVWIKDTKTIYLVDYIKNALVQKRDFMDYQLTLHQFLPTDGVLDVITLNDGTIIQRYILTVQFEWIGNPLTQ